MLKMTEEQYCALRDNGGGVCLACKEEASGVEPDARNYECEACGAKRVFGIEELLIMGMIDLVSKNNLLKNITFLEHYGKTEKLEWPDDPKLRKEVDKTKTEEKIEKLRTEWKDKMPKKEVED